MAFVVNTPLFVSSYLSEDENNIVLAIHVSYARRHFIENLYWMKYFRTDIHVSWHIIINVFTENQHYSQFTVRILA